MQSSPTDCTVVTAYVYSSLLTGTVITLMNVVPLNVCETQECSQLCARYSGSDSWGTYAGEAHQIGPRAAAVLALPNGVGCQVRGRLPR